MDLMDYRRKIIANSPHLMSAEGAVVSFADGADLPLKSLIVDIDPVQSGSGDPSPTNIRPISGWNAVNVKNGNTVIATISLGETVYGGTLNPLTGVLMVTHISDTQKLSAYNVVSTGANTVHYRLFDSAFNTSLPKTTDSGNFSNVAKNVYNSSDTTHFYPNISNGRIELWLPIGTDTNTDVQIVCELATPYTIQLTPQQIRTLYGNNTIFADTGNVALEYWAHP